MSPSVAGSNPLGRQDLVETILNRLDADDLQRASGVCRLWREVAATPALRRRALDRMELVGRQPVAGVLPNSMSADALWAWAQQGMRQRRRGVFREEQFHQKSRAAAISNGAAVAVLHARSNTLSLHMPASSGGQTLLQPDDFPPNLGPGPIALTWSQDASTLAMGVGWHARQAVGVCHWRIRGAVDVLRGPLRPLLGNVLALSHDGWRVAWAHTEPVAARGWMPEVAVSGLGGAACASIAWRATLQPQALCFAPDGGRLLVVGRGAWRVTQPPYRASTGSLAILDIEKGPQGWQLVARSHLVLPARCLEARFSGDGKSVFTALRTGEICQWSLDGLPLSAWSLSVVPDHLAMGPGARVVALLFEGHVWIADCSRPTFLRPLTWGQRVQSLWFQEDGRWLVVAGAQTQRVLHFIL